MLGGTHSETAAEPESAARPAKALKGARLGLPDPWHPILPSEHRVNGGVGIVRRCKRREPTVLAAHGAGR